MGLLAPAPRPILVTGAPRAATTWVGRTLAMAPGTFYLHEPFHRWYPRTRRTLRPAPIDHWYLHVHAGNADRYRPYLADNLGRSYHLGRELRGMRRITDPVGILRRCARHLLGRARGLRTIMKDPQALFSAEWLAEELGCRVVITVRHPLSWVGSIKRLKANMDPSVLVVQRELMEDLLAPLAENLRRGAAEWRPDLEGRDLVANAALQWRAFYTAVATYRERHPDWIFVRHEDFARSPHTHFADLFRRLGLDLTEEARSRIAANSNAAPNAPGNEAFGIQRNSREAIRDWRRRLNADEAEYVRRKTEDVARFFYEDAEWNAEEVTV